MVSLAAGDDTRDPPKLGCWRRPRRREPDSLYLEKIVTWGGGSWTEVCCDTEGVWCVMSGWWRFATSSLKQPHHSGLELFDTLLTFDHLVHTFIHIDIQARQIVHHKQTPVKEPARYHVDLLDKCDFRTHLVLPGNHNQGMSNDGAGQWSHDLFEVITGRVPVSCVSCGAGMTQWGT